MQENRDRPIIELFKEMQIESRLQYILLYALGMINEKQVQDISEALIDEKDL